MSRKFPILILWAAYAGFAAAQPSSKPPLIEHVRVFDGSQILIDTSVLVENGVIRSVGATSAPAGANVVDGSGKTLLPGLMDAHTHTFGEAALKQAPIFGVTTDLDMFTDPKAAAAIKKHNRKGSFSITRI